MARHRIYQYTSIGRPLEPSYPTNRAVLYILPLSLALGGGLGWVQGQSLAPALLQGLDFALLAFGGWALARELGPDDDAAAFFAMALALLAALTMDEPGILVIFATLALVRIVNRTTGLPARRTDSVLVMALALLVIYLTESPFFGLVAAVAFALDGSLKDPLRHQWIFALIGLGGTVVYMVDHDVGLSYLQVPHSLFEWIALLFLLIFALNTLLLSKVRSTGDVNGGTLDLNRVRGGMAVGLIAALQGINRPAEVVGIVAAIAGICVGMALRKGFKPPGGN
jgi:hypothetical protein